MKVLPGANQALGEESLKCTQKELFQLLSKVNFLHEL